MWDKFPKKSFMPTPPYHQLHFGPRLQATISLNGSKSITNRAAVLAALSGQPCRLTHPAECDDATALERALHDADGTVSDVGAAGTAMRFMTAVFTLRPGGSHVLTGSERMRRRPIQILVDALRAVGARIDYEGVEGYPPLRIHGQRPTGGELTMPAQVSSQYISAMLMIAPLLERGLRLHLDGTVASRPYIDMTLRLMQRFGAQAGWEPDGQTLLVEPQPYTAPEVFDVEPDWSGASYWYEMMALTPDAHARVALPRLTAQSVQGDARVAEWFSPLGVHTAFTPEGAVLTRCAPTARPTRLELNLEQQPDLAQTLAVTAALLNLPFRLEGLHSLRIKETDRLEALACELGKLGYTVTVEGDDALRWDGLQHEPHYEGGIATYDDHRMAMAFAPCAYRYDGLRILHPEVVSKSYPTFWADLEAATSRS